MGKVIYGGVAVTFSAQAEPLGACPTFTVVRTLTAQAEQHWQNPHRIYLTR